MVSAYLSGDTVNALAQQFRVHRTTVMAHLARRHVKRPDTLMAEWDDDTLAAVTRLYISGASLAQVGARFGVHASIVANRLRRVGVPMRRRRG